MVSEIQIYVSANLRKNKLRAMIYVFLFSAFASFNHEFPQDLNHLLPCGPHFVW